MKVRVFAGLVVVAMLAGVGSASAQGLGVGVKIGPNFSTVSGNPRDFGTHSRKHTKVDLTAGAFVTVPVSEMVGFQPEFLYQRRGVKVDDINFAVPPRFKFEIDEVEIPLLLRLGRSAENRGFYFLAGPTVGFLTKAESSAEAGGATTDLKANDEVKSSEVGLTFGVGMTWEKWLFEFRYTRGLTDITKDPAPNDTKRKGISSAILFGYQFK